MSAICVRGTRRTKSRRPATRSTDQSGGVAFPTALGWMGLAWQGPSLVRLTFGHRSEARALRELATGRARQVPPFIVALSDRCQRYAAGEPVPFEDIEISLDHLTPFGRRVIENCRCIRYGQTLSYGQLAAKAGSPRAARAVGNLMAQNRYALIVPCHRVVGANRSLGGFSAAQGISMKRKLLRMESQAVGV